MSQSHLTYSFAVNKCSCSVMKASKACMQNVTMILEGSYTLKVHQTSVTYLKWHV